MKYFSVTEFASKNGVSDSTIRNYCVEGKLEGAFLTGKTWNIPEDAQLPAKGSRAKTVSPLLKTLREEKDSNIKGGIYHRTQIDLAYNSNHIEGSQLTHEQTRYIFDTQTLGITNEAVRVDDIMETVNHFRCLDLIIDKAEEKLNEQLIKDLHAMQKFGTHDSTKSWFVVGDYKRLPNEVGGRETALPENVGKEIKSLLKEYNSKKEKNIDDLLDFHVRFERIHPFQDGNGRVGRLLLFKECLANKIVPFIITDELKMFYYRGLNEWPEIPGYLRDTCLSAQDNYVALLKYFRIKI